MRVTDGWPTILQMIETSGPGGAEKVLACLAHSMHMEQLRAVVILRSKGWLYDELLARGVEAHVIPESGTFDVPFLLRVVQIIKRRRVSVIHAHEFLMSLYGTAAGVLSATPVVTTFHGKYYYWENLRRRMAMRAISRGSQIVAVSHDLRSFLGERVGIEAERVRTIYNGIDPAGYLRRSEGSDLKGQLAIGEDVYVVGTVGNLYPVKGQIFLIRAIPEVLRCFPGTVFLLAGRGDQDEALRLEAKRLRVFENVRFLGFRSDIAELLSIMDVFVLPSLSECLPLSVLEAMAVGVPPVVTEVGGNREIIEDGRSGFVIRAAEPEAIAEKVKLLLADGEQRAKIGSEAQRIVSCRFSERRMVSEYSSLYYSVMGERTS